MKRTLQEEWLILTLFFLLDDPALRCLLLRYRNTSGFEKNLASVDGSIKHCKEICTLSEQHPYSSFFIKAGWCKLQHYLFYKGKYEHKIHDIEKNKAYKFPFKVKTKN